MDRRVRVPKVSRNKGLVDGGVESTGPGTGESPPAQTTHFHRRTGRLPGAAAGTQAPSV
jgi:hypothetical protein